MPCRDCVAEKESLTSGKESLAILRKSLTQDQQRLPEKFWSLLFVLTSASSFQVFQFFYQFSVAIFVLATALTWARIGFITTSIE
jgi:hypothetical protein